MQYSTHRLNGHEDVSLDLEHLERLESFDCASNSLVPSFRLSVVDYGSSFDLHIKILCHLTVTGLLVS